MRQIMLVIFAAPVLAALLVSTATVRAQGSDAGALYRQFLEAQNRGDVGAQLALLTDDATIVVDGPGSLCPPPAGCVGKAAIQRQLELRVATGAQSAIPQAQVTGDTAIAQIEVRNPELQRAGIDRILYNNTIVERGGKIASVRAVLDPTDPGTASLLAALRARAAAAPGQGPQGPSVLPQSGGITSPRELLAVGGLALALLGGALRMGRPGRTQQPSA
jgi:ketosteroid isomerase-like protein